jgi:hypothetical protein
MGVVAANAHDPDSQKVFAALFSKSACFLPVPACLTHPSI